MAAILRPTAANLAKLARHLRRGGLVAVPTETVYGLAADALNPQACGKIFVAKGRPKTDPLIVHVRAESEVEALAEISPEARKLFRRFWPGPLTIVLPRKAVVPDLVTAGGETVAIRCPAHPVMRRLLELSGVPLAAPSANPFGYISPTTARHVAEGLGRKIPFILDGGPSAVGVESTIVDLSRPRRPRLLRTGEVSAADLRRVLRCPIEVVEKRGRSHRRQIAPGMLTRHYSPNTPLTLHAKLSPARLAAARHGEAFLLFRKPRRALPAAVKIFVLAPHGTTREAARRLYAGLHELDRAGFTHLHAELAPARGAGAAINDRLRRAAARRSAE